MAEGDGGCEGEKVLVFREEDAGKIPGLRVSPVGVVEGEEKLRMIHDSSFVVDTEEAGGPPVNPSTYFEENPECEMATVMKEILVRCLGLRAKCPQSPILIQKMDVKSAFRQIPVDPREGAGIPLCSRQFRRGRRAAPVRLEREPAVVWGGGMGDRTCSQENHQGISQVYRVGVEDVAARQDSAGKGV